MGGYKDDTAATMRNRTIDAMATSARVTSVGLGNCPPLVSCWHLSDVFPDETADLPPTNVVAAVVTYNITPGFLGSAGITVAAGRGLTWHDDKNAPSVAVINQAFAHKVFGSAKALGSYYKTRAGKRIPIPPSGGAERSISFSVLD